VRARARVCVRASQGAMHDITLLVICVLFLNGLFFRHRNKLHLTLHKMQLLPLKTHIKISVPL